MATERQIAANRRNAGKSTGPRSSAGRKRASRNSYRHGLRAKNTLDAERAKRVETLARAIAGDAQDTVTLEHARSAAHAEFDLARIRQVKIALIERMRIFGDFGVSALPGPVESVTALHSPEPEHLAEAIRRVLPELIKLDRYERRAAARRFRAILNID